MKTLLASALLLITLLVPPGFAATSGAAPPAAAADSVAIGELLTHALTQIQSEDFEGARKTLLTITAHPAFDVGPNAAKFGVLSYLGMVEASLGELDSAFDHLLRAGRLAPQGRGADYWTMLAAVSRSLGEDRTLVESVMVLVRDHAANAAEWEELVVEARRSAGRLAYGAGPHLELLEALWQAQFEPSSPYATSQGHWFDLLTLYAEAGDDAKAREVLPAIVRPDLVAALGYDARFTGIAPAQPGTAFADALARDVAAKRKMMAEHPRDLHAVHALADQLDWANRSAEALEVIEAALGRNGEVPPGQLPFDDLDEYLAWTENARSRALQHLGRWDEAVAAQVRARDASIDDPISQSVNLGVLYYQLGRSDEALEAIAPLGDAHASDYGLMAIEEVRICANHQLGHADAVAQSMAFMAAHADKGYLPLRAAMLCIGDLDGLAALIIDRLDDPRTRTETLEGLQAYLPALHNSPVTSELQARFNAVRERADVRAAIGRHGLVREWPVRHDWS